MFQKKWLSKHDDTMYTSTSFKSTRSGLNICLSLNKKLDIVEDQVFKEANNNFTDCLVFNSSPL